MFTGIIECRGTVTTTHVVTTGRHICVDAGPVAEGCEVGTSVCVAGVCLTVSRANRATLEFDVVAETLDKSTLGSRRVGDQVNLERALRIGDRLDGHFVQGHVDGTATVDQILTSSGDYVLRLRAGPLLLPCIVPRGSVCVDGVSLTIAAVDRDTFSVALIPTTLERTTLSSLSAGDRVNIETDIITRTVVQRMSEMEAAGGLTLGSLREAGFA